MVKIQIKSVLGKLLFEYEKKDNTIKYTLIEAVKSGADLRDAYLSGANLRAAYLSGADLRGAYLRDANLRGADLSGAYLRDANLSGADLSGAELSGANLSDAYLSGAELSGAYLRGAYLSDAELSGAYLRGADLQIIKAQFCIIPTEGSFIAYKKASECIVKISIPIEAKRTWNIKSRKCRAEFVDVLEITRNGKPVKQAIGNHDGETKYIVGKRTVADSFNDTIFEDCTHGIHFFVTREEAEAW